MTQPIKISELEKVLDRIIKERENICGSGVRSSFRVDDISRLCEALRIAHVALHDMSINVSLEWYLEYFGKDQTSSGASTGIAATMHNIELRQRAYNAFKNLREAITKIQSLVDLS